MLLRTFAHRVAAVAADAPRSALLAASGARIYIISPKIGAKVTSPVTIKFGHKGLGIAPAGDKTPNTGHFHLLIDQALPADLSVPLPVTDHILHYGKAQTEATWMPASCPPASTRCSW